jgi:hypothetical protein
MSHVSSRRADPLEGMAETKVRSVWFVYSAQNVVLTSGKCDLYCNESLKVCQGEVYDGEFDENERMNEKMNRVVNSTTVRRGMQW